MSHCKLGKIVCAEAYKDCLQTNIFSTGSGKAR